MRFASESVFTQSPRIRWHAFGVLHSGQEADNKMPGRSESTLRARGGARDGLTGTFTRPYFLNLLHDECRFAHEMGKPFCICLVDIDQLRKVNEQRGLRAGDELLAGTAESIRSALDLPQWHNLRCLMGRYDGDSLVLLLPGCRLNRAEQFVHVLKRRVARLECGGTTVTVSIAVAACKADDSVDNLLARLEKTMCLAKQFGGNSVEVARTAELTRDLASVTRLPVPWRERAEHDG